MIGRYAAATMPSMRSGWRHSRTVADFDSCLALGSWRTEEAANCALSLAMIDTTISVGLASVLR